MGEGLVGLGHAVDVFLLLHRTAAPGGGPTVYASCTVNGASFLPLTTYLSPASVFLCGDGVCQFTESPYDPLTGAGCLSDCGSL